MKLVTFIGIERGDFVYYLSMVLRNLKSTVLILDNSNSGDLFFSLTRKKLDACEDLYLEFENMLFIRGIKYSPETFNKFDYVLCFNGWGQCDDVVVNSDLIYIMPDYHLSSLDNVKKIFKELSETIINEEDHKVSIIMRDLVSEKITDMAVANYIGTEVERIVGHIAFDPMDAAKQISFEYSGTQSVKGLSPDYINGLGYVAMQLTEKSDKVIKNLLKKA